MVFTWKLHGLFSVTFAFTHSINLSIAMKKHTTSRRKFLQTSALVSGMSLGLPAVIQAHDASVTVLPPNTNKTLVFQGDSITDGGRNRKRNNANGPGGLGAGYVSLIVGQLMGKNPGSGWKCYNRGISGNKVFQLADRWEEDCLDLKPDILSILIGVNDYWHMFNGKYDGTVEIYERDYRALLDRTIKALPNVKLIIGEPFGVRGGTAIKENWYPNFDNYCAAAKRVADDYGAIFIPLQSLFAKALEKAPASYWCPDGVHPAPAGNYLMAQAWLKSHKESE